MKQSLRGRFLTLVHWRCKPFQETGTLWDSITVYPGLAWNSQSSRLASNSQTPCHCFSAAGSGGCTILPGEFHFKHAHACKFSLMGMNVSVWSLGCPACMLISEDNLGSSLSAVGLGIKLWPWDPWSHLTSMGQSFFLYSRFALNSLCIPDWPQTLDFSLVVFQVLEFQAHVSMLR